LSLLPSQKEVVAAVDRKIRLVTEGLQPYILNYFKILGIINGTILADYIIAANQNLMLQTIIKKR
jgi:hypothetical protein